VNLLRRDDRGLLLSLLPLVAVLVLVFAGPLSLALAVPLTAVAALLPALYLLQMLRRQRQASAAFIQRLIDVIPDPVFIKKAGGHYLMINQAFATYRQVDKLSWRGFGLHSDPPPDPAQRDISRREDAEVLAGAEIEKEDHTIRRATGEEVFRIISKRRSVFVDGEPVIVGVERHITRWKLAERELTAVLARETLQRQRTERFVQDLIDVIPHPVYVKTAQGAYCIVNEAFATYRRQPKPALIGLRSRDLTKDADLAALAESEDQLVLAGEVISKEQYTLQEPGGDEVYRVVNKRRCVAVDGSLVVVGIDHYITEWRLAERRLKQLAEEDVLTGLTNRRHFSVEARRALEHEQRYGLKLSLLLFDLDFFKRVNDEHGHNVGDEVLVEMAYRMLACFRKSDLPGRWGGEEFIALLPHTPIATAVQVAERLRASLADVPVQTQAGPIRVTLSGGCAQWQAGDTLESLVGRADAALYRAKHSGRNRIESA
jgi:diguanylate cyclase (GGDEF)-like protein